MPFVLLWMSSQKGGKHVHVIDFCTLYSCMNLFPESLFTSQGGMPQGMLPCAEGIQKAKYFLSCSLAMQLRHSRTLCKQPWDSVSWTYLEIAMGGALYIYHCFSPLLLTLRHFGIKASEEPSKGLLSCNIFCDPLVLFNLELDLISPATVTGRSW